MCVPDKAELLSDPNMWITDTGATVHSMPYDMGFVETRMASDSDKVTMGNGADVSAMQITKLHGVVCNKHGKELDGAVLDQVCHLPDVKFNLFSLSRMMRKMGWQMGRNKDAIWVEKDGDQIKFDIIIPMPKGALYCMYFLKGKAKCPCP
jgi:hypothetical protein